MSLSRVILRRGGLVVEQALAQQQGLRQQSGNVIPLVFSHSFATGQPNLAQEVRSAAEVRNTSLNNETRRKIVPTPYTKKMLVWSGQYASEDEIPDEVTSGQVSKARGWFRMRLSTVMMVLTLVICALIVRGARQEIRDGHNVSEENIKWHQSMGSKK